MRTYFVNQDGTVETSRPSKETVEIATIAKAPKARQPTHPPKPGRRVSRPFTICPHCAASVRQSNISKHIAARCPKRPTASVQKATATTDAPDQQAILDVPAAVPASGPPAAHPGKPRPSNGVAGLVAARSAPPTTPSKEGASLSDRVHCPRCNETVIAARLEHHLNRVHDTSLPSTTQPVSNVAPPSKKSATGTPPTPHQAHDSSPKKVPPRDRTILRSGQQKTTTNAPRAKQRESEDERPWEPRRAERRGQDGSSGVGHFAREEGRFGSFPSYDPMDDESGA